MESPKALPLFGAAALESIVCTTPLITCKVARFRLPVCLTPEAQEVGFVVRIRASVAHAYAQKHRPTDRRKPNMTNKLSCA